jgi:hypothetical protein
MIDPLKPLGAFIENTIRPLLGEFKWFFEECDKRGIKLNEENITRVARVIGNCHFRTVAFDALKSVLITGIICLTYLASR